MDRFRFESIAIKSIPWRTDTLYVSDGLGKLRDGGIVGHFTDGAIGEFYGGHDALVFLWIRRCLLQTKTARKSPGG